LKDVLISYLAKAGFKRQTVYGNMAGAPFEPEKNPNLVILAWQEP
jgi:hypothetical protein